jgi:UDP-3-O-[3-hydroxymyristoyl] glucosamine N-acyltransferase
METNSFISKMARIGKGVKIGNNVNIRDNVSIGANTFIGDNVTIGEPLIDYYRKKSYRNPRTAIGANSIIRSGSIIYTGTETGKNFHTGHNVVIRESSKFGDFCVFGTFSQSDGYIKVGNYCRFHNNVFLAQKTMIGNYVWVSPFVVTLDSPHPPCRKYPCGPTIGDYAVIGAQSIILPRVKIGSRSIVACGSTVSSDVARGTLVAGSPARPAKKAGEIKCRVVSSRRPYPWPLDAVKNRIY